MAAGLELFQPIRDRLPREVGGRPGHFHECQLERQAGITALAHVLDRDVQQVDQPQHRRLAELVRLLAQPVARLLGDRQRVGHLAHVLHEQKVSQVLEQVGDEPAEVLSLLGQLLDERERAGGVAVDDEVEEPPPHLVFVFCTTDLAKVLQTVRSRCQTFVFARPRLPELVRVLRPIADAEKIEAPDAVLALIARGARGSFRDAVSTLDQLASATGNTIDVQSVLQLLGAVEEDALFRLCDAIVDRDTAGALLFVEELAEQGQDLARLVTDLLEHLRHLLLVQHMGHVPDSLPITDETRERLREQANQLPAPTVLRLCDLLAVALEDSRQGADPRLPLELALVKVTSPGSDLSRESLAFRVEQLEQRLTGSAVPATPVAVSPAKPEQPTPVAPQPPPVPAAPVEAPPLGLDQLQDAWQRTVLPAVQSRSIPVASLLGEARPATLEGEMLTLEFPASADFHRRQAEEPKNVSVIREALYEVTGHRLAVTLALGEAEDAVEEEDEALTEEALISMFKDTFDATEVEDTR